MANSILFTLMLASCLASMNIDLVLAARDINMANFFNKSGCLYCYQEDGQYLITFPESESHAGTLTKPQYDTQASTCTDPTHHTAQLSMTFDISDNNMEKMSLDFNISESTSEGYWEINNVTLNIFPHNAKLFPNTTIELKPVDIYAGLGFSYSCSALVLENSKPTSDKPHFKLTLRRFQVQPFASMDVFAPSYDCAVWLTLPVVMGMVLILFITFTVMIGVYLLLELGNQSSDLKFSKQGGMLMNQAQLDATKG